VELAAIAGRADGGGGADGVPADPVVRLRAAAETARDTQLR